MGCKHVQLSDVATLTPGFAFKSKDFGNYDAKAIKITDVSDDCCSSDLTGVNIDKYSLAKMKKYLVHPGDYFLAMTGSIGKVGRITVGSAYLNQRVLGVRPSAAINKGYLWHLLNSNDFKNHLLTHIDSHSVQANISAKSVGSFEFDLPERAIQDAIASILGSFDSKIQCNTRLNGYLLELAMARFESALEAESKTVRFGDIVALEDSKRVPLNSRDREARKGPYPYYGATSVMDHVNDYLFDEIRVLLGEDGTVIDSKGRPILQYVWGKYWVNNHAHILAPSGEYSLEAIYIALRRTAINHIVTGAVQMKISQRNLKSLELEMPSPKSLGYLQDLFAAYRINQDESAKLAGLRDALLPRLMSGEIDVTKVDLTQLNSHLA